MGLLKYLNDLVRNNTLSPARVANALDAGRLFTASGTDTYAVTIGLGVTTLNAGDVLNIIFTNANTSTTPTLAVTGSALIGTYTIKGNDGGAIAAGDLKAGGKYDLHFDGTVLKVTNIGGGGGGGTGAWADLTGSPTDNSDLVTYVESERDNAKSYADSLVVGLWDDRGSFDASGGTYPSSGGSGTAGAIKKGDVWTISVAGTLPTGQVVEVGDVVRALIDTPGNTQANWAIQQNNIGYTAENSANKATTMSGNTTSNVVYLTAKAIYDWATSTFQSAITAATWGDFMAALTGKTIPVDADSITISDSAASDDAKKVTLTNLWTNYFKGKADALYVGVQDLYIPASAMWPRTTSGCASLAKSEMTTSLVNIQTLDFDQTTQEFAQFTVVLPRKYNNGTVTAVFYWTASSGSGDVQWGISGGAYSNDDALTVALGTAQTVDDTLIATNDLHITSATSAITLAGSPADADFLAFQISRNPASDTLSGDAKLLGVSIRITTDSGVDA